jgi:hypothetical protein
MTQKSKKSKPQDFDILDLKRKKKPRADSDKFDPYRKNKKHFFDRVSNVSDE